MLPNAPAATPGTPLALLQALAALTGRRLPTEQALITAVLAGACSYVAIAEWVHALPISVRVRLGLGPMPPE